MRIQSGSTRVIDDRCLSYLLLELCQFRWPVHRDDVARLSLASLLSSLSAGGRWQ
jgi:hypothetical protein